MGKYARRSFRLLKCLFFFVREIKHFAAVLIRRFLPFAGSCLTLSDGRKSCISYRCSFFLRTQTCFASCARRFCAFRTFPSRLSLTYRRLIENRRWLLLFFSSPTSRGEKWRGGRNVDKETSEDTFGI